MRVKSWHTFDERLKLSVLGNGAGIGCGKVQQSNPRWGRLLGSLARRSSCRKKRIFFKEVFRNVGKKPWRINWEMPNAAHKPFSFLLGLWDERFGFFRFN